MSAGRLCIREVLLADADESVTDAAIRMRDRHVGTLVVIDPERRPIGIVTDRDIVVRAVAAGATELRVRHCRSTTCSSCSRPSSPAWASSCPREE